VNRVLSAWNEEAPQAAMEAMMACCGARRWAAAMVTLRPIRSVGELSAAADRIWSTMEEVDWMEAFACHPRIGERKAAHVQPARALAELAAGNALYEQRFGFTYIVCATGKSAEEMLAILNRRLSSDRTEELREASEQQRQITQIRLGKWLVE
jgi:2-oxo-4-hydroxy-4-carboxy-5-ureidoimidazoline decarboxylase